MEFHAAKALEPIQLALQKAMPDAQFDVDPGEQVAAISFVHPAHEATVIVVVEQPDPHHLVPTLLLAVVLGDWQDARAPQANPEKGEGGAALFGLNPRLMTCAVGILPINDDELALALCRRLPLESMPAEDVLPTIDDMVWEYAAVAGWMDQQKVETETLEPPTDLRPPRPRIIGSLDEA